MGIPIHCVGHLCAGTDVFSRRPRIDVKHFAGRPARLLCKDSLVPESIGWPTLGQVDWLVCEWRVWNIQDLKDWRRKVSLILVDV